MAGLEDLISRIPIGDLAEKLGVDEATASAAVGKAIPALLGGMQANTASGGASSLEKAVSSHSAALVDGGVSLDDVDTEDGKKIVSHVFGGSKSQVTSALGGDDSSGGGMGDVIGKALPILAPIVMSYLAQRSSAQKETAAQTTSKAKKTTATTSSSKKTVTQKTTAAAESSGGGIVDLLGGLLGGGSSSGSSSSGGLGDLLGSLGGLLGGGSK